MDLDSTRRLLEALEREGVRYAVFGGVALNFHGLARFTEDLDVFIAPTAENITALKRALKSVYEDPEIEEITSDDLLGEYPAIQYLPPTGTFRVDILTRLGDAFHFEDLEIERKVLDNLEVSVVSARTLYEMKRDTVRLRDKADAALLRERFGLEDD